MSKPRHEIKIFLNFSNYLSITQRLKAFVKPDSNSGENGKYKIRSLYFDNYNDKALLEKINGINNREKFRIRYYNNDFSYIKLEKKSKRNGLCYKEASSLTVEETNKIIIGDIDFLINSNDKLKNEFYFKLKTQCLKPKTIVDYTREAYTYPVGNVRLTIDSKIRSGLFSTDFFNCKLPTVGVIEEDPIILEVKYDNFLPDIIRDLIQTNTSEQRAVSKYSACRLLKV